MFKTLLSVQLSSLFNSMFRVTSKNQRRKKALTILLSFLLVYAVIAMSAYLGFMLYFIGGPLIEGGLSWFYFCTIGLMLFAVNFISALFMGQSMLFEAKDNELLLSMPIPASHILISRLILFAALNYAYSIVLAIVGYAVHCLFIVPPAFASVLYFLSALLLPLLPLALSCVLAYAVGMLCAKIGHKTLINTVLFVLFAGACYGVYSLMQGYFSQLVLSGSELGSALQQALPPFYAFAMASQGDIWAFLQVLAWSIIPAFIVYEVLSRNFMKIVLTRPSARRRATSAAGDVKSRSLRSTIFAKEIKRLLTLPIYFINTCFGSVMVLVLGGGLLFMGPQVLDILAESVPALADNLTLLLLGFLGFSTSFNSTTSPSISLEGRSIYMLKSLPLRAMDVLAAKAWVNLVMSIPAIVITAVICWFVLPLSPWHMAVLLILPCLVQLFSALMGLIANLLFPRFDWVNETVVVKQSAATMVSVLGGLGILGVAIALCAIAMLVFNLSIDVILAISTIYYLILCVGAYIFLQKRGDALFARL